MRSNKNRLGWRFFFILFFYNRNVVPHFRHQTSYEISARKETYDDIFTFFFVVVHFPRLGLFTKSL